MEYIYSLMCPITSTAPGSAAKMAYKLSKIQKMFDRPKLHPKKLTISYFCSAAGLAVFSDRLERFHPTGSLRIASHPWYREFQGTKNG